MRLRQRQTRSFPIDDVQAGDAGQIIYHASIFGIEDSYGTIFDQGAFARTTAEASQPPAGVAISDFLRNAPGGYFSMAWFHTPWEPIGLSKVSEDATGLVVHGELDLDVERGRDVYSGVKRGYINAASHSFDVIAEEMRDNKTHFTQVRLYETSPLTMHFGSNPLALMEEVRAEGRLRYPLSPMDAAEIFLRELSGVERAGAILQAVKTFSALRERDLTDEERLLITECSGSLQALLQPTEGRPYPNEHACRLQAPSKFSDFRRGSRKHEGKTYYIIFGQRKDDETKWEEQAYRYPKDTWEAGEARAHCKSHDGSFEAASGQDSISCALCRAPIDASSPIALPDARDLVAALASRGPASPPPGAGRTPSIAPGLHALLTEVRAVERRLQ
jgi:HK97 family phage prohead protease